MLNISETLIVGVDMIPGDEPTIMVAKRDYPQMKFIRKIVGNDAIVAYSMITNIKIKAIMNDDKVCCPSCSYDITSMGPVNYCPNCGMGLEWPMDKLEEKEEIKNMEGGK